MSILPLVFNGPREQTLHPPPHHHPWDFWPRTPAPLPAVLFIESLCHLLADPSWDRTLLWVILWPSWWPGKGPSSTSGAGHPVPKGDWTVLERHEGLSGSKETAWTPAHPSPHLPAGHRALRGTEVEEAQEGSLEGNLSLMSWTERGSTRLHEIN